MILVTGATGTVGSEVVRQLAARGVPARAGCHHPDQADWIRDLGLAVVPFDYQRPETIEDALRDVDHLFLLTPYDAEQVGEAETTIDIAKRMDVEHVVRLSVIGANPRRGITIARWHGEVEQYLMDSGLGWTMLRPNSYMNNFAEYYGAMIRQDNALYLPMGDGQVSYIAADDIAAVAVEALVNPGHERKKYVLTGPQALSVGEVADILRASTGRPITYVDISMDDARKRLKAMGMPDWRVDTMMEIFEVQRDGHASVITDTVQQVTGRLALSFEAWSCRHADRFAAQWAA